MTKKKGKTFSSAREVMDHCFPGSFLEQLARSIKGAVYPSAEERMLTRLYSKRKEDDVGKTGQVLVEHEFSAPGIEDMIKTGIQTFYKRKGFETNESDTGMVSAKNNKESYWIHVTEEGQGIYLVRVMDSPLKEFEMALESLEL